LDKVRKRDSGVQLHEIRAFVKLASIELTALGEVSELREEDLLALLETMLQLFDT